MAALGYQLGCPFWSFADWNGSLFSVDARPEDRLRQYASVFNSVEGNTTFYSVPSERTVARWREEVPGDFRFVFKLPREVTHDRLLEDADDEAERFLRAMAPLEQRLGPFLVQLPPSFGPERLPLLERFLRELTRDFVYAVELRHPAFFEDESLAGHCDEILLANGCSRVMMDTRALRAGDPSHPEVRAALHKKPDLPLRPEAIGPHPIVRCVGHPESVTTDPFLEEWAERVAAWLRQGLDPYFFMHTPSNLRTPEIARELHERIGKRREVGDLPSFAGERGERRDGQLSLL